MKTPWSKLSEVTKPFLRSIGGDAKIKTTLYCFFQSSLSIHIQELYVQEKQVLNEENESRSYFGAMSGSSRNQVSFVQRTEPLIVSILDCELNIKTPLNSLILDSI